MGRSDLRAFLASAVVAFVLTAGSLVILWVVFHPTALNLPFPGPADDTRNIGEVFPCKTAPTLNDERAVAASPRIELHDAHREGLRRG